MREVRIEIPQYIQEIRLAEKRMKKYYKKTSKTIPEKYLVSIAPGSPHYGTKVLKSGYSWKKDKVFDELNQQFVIANSRSFGTPRIKFIAGNDIYEGGRRARQVIVEAIRKSFIPQMPKELNLKFPITIEAEFHVDPRFANWDIGNLWIYDKVFEDVLQHVGLIPNDNIRYVTKSGGAQFVPIVNNEERKLVFILREETDPRVLSHVMYDLNNVKSYFFPKINEEWSIPPGVNVLSIHITTTGKAGDIFFEKSTVTISIGKKKIVWGAVRKAMASIFSLAIQLNAHVEITTDIYKTFNKFVEEELRLKGITIYVTDRGNELHGDSQHAANDVQT